MKVLFVCGKGGVGKTAVTAGLAHHCSQYGGALAITLNDPDSLVRHLKIPELGSEPRAAAPGLSAVCLEKQQILDDYITSHLPFGILKNWILEHPLYPHLAAVTPGLREVLLLDRIFQFASLEYISQWNTVIVDMPATGHGTSLLNVTAVAAAAVKYGPLRRRLQQVCEKLQDPRFSRAVVVTLAEDTPMRESRELILALQNQAAMAIDALVVNRIDLQPMSMESLNAMDALDDSELQLALTQNGMDDVQLTAASVRNAVRLQHARARLGSEIIQALSTWWQEPIIRIQHFTVDDPSELVPAIGSALEAAGYHD